MVVALCESRSVLLLRVWSQTNIKTLPHSTEFTAREACIIRIRIRYRFGIGKLR